MFRHGQELVDAEASDAVLKFGHKIEVGISRPEEPETDNDPGDSTGAGWKLGTPAVYGWRVWKATKGPGVWVGTFFSPEAATADAERAREMNPELTGLPIVPVYPMR